MKSLFFSLLLLLFTATPPTSAQSLNLPELGNSSSSIVSLQQEKQLGQYWLRAFRQQGQLYDDPLLYSYVTQLIQKLMHYSDLKEKYFDLLLVNDANFNAFAVPGNIVGVNSGLFLYADSEDQLASVLAHELGHLSQRHYARSLEQRKRANALSLAGLLGGLLLIAAGGGDAGFAALTATQAAAIDSQLRYSRSHEQEADRVGIHTLAGAGMNPEAAAHMFQHILDITRYRSDVRDFAFLLTHPMTDSRVSDALNLAKQFPKMADKDNLYFHLMKVRVYLHYSNKAENAEAYFKQQLPRARYPEAYHYGIALALLAQNKVKEAMPIIHDLYQQAPQNNAYQLVYLQMIAASEGVEKAITHAKQMLTLTPNNYVLSLLTVQFYQQIKAYEPAGDILRDLIKSGWPDSADIWLLYAENEGMAGNIYHVHIARAEYFERMGAYSQALKQLNYAKPVAKNDLIKLSQITVREEQIHQQLKDAPF